MPSKQADFNLREHLETIPRLDWVTAALYRPSIGCNEGLLVWFRSQGVPYKWMVDHDLQEVHAFVRRAALLEVRNGGKDFAKHFENLVDTLTGKTYIAGRSDTGDSSEKLDFAGVLTTTVPEKLHIRVLTSIFWCPSSDTYLRWTPTWFHVTTLYKHAYQVALSRGDDERDFLRTLDEIRQLADPWTSANETWV